MSKAFLLLALSITTAHAVDEIPDKFRFEFKRCEWYAENTITGRLAWIPGVTGNEKVPERCGRIERDDITHRNKIFKVKEWKLLKEGIEISTTEGVKCTIVSRNNGIYQVDWNQLPGFPEGYSFRTRP